MSARLVMPTRILVTGAGAREHALAWKLASEPGVNQVYVLPGNAGMRDLPQTTVLGSEEFKSSGADFAAIARRLAIELAVIGPEAHLTSGWTDTLTAAGVPTFGPTASAARIEGSKAFCREIATAAGVPMAAGRAFSRPADALAAAMELANAPGARGVVVKQDGLAAGKGVTVCDTAEQAAKAVRAAFADASAVVIEERLFGPEASVIALCDGRDAIALPAARDHKRLGDGDAGPNTGGMGAYSPLADLPDDDVAAIVERFHKPVLAELAKRATPFRGALYAGLMLTDAGPRLLEFNCRFGDPEAQVILPRLAGPLGPWLLAAARGGFPREAPGKLETFAEPAVGIVLAAAGYPEQPRAGDRIEGIDTAQTKGALVFHAGTTRADDGGYETAGGRVLTVVGRGGDLAAARATAETAAAAISWDGMQRRHDIGAHVPGEPAAIGSAP